MRHGSAPITLTTLVINGVGEELFFRDVARRQLADVLSPPRHPGPTSPLHRRHRRNGHPLLLVASILIGGNDALEARRADSLISATTLHLEWSIGMAPFLPVAD